MGCSLVCGVKFVGLLSALLAAAVTGISAWLLKDTYEARQSRTGQAISAVSNFGSSVFGRQGGVDLESRILIGVSAATLAAGALQLITSLFLLFCSSSKGGRVSARLWLFVSVFVILATGGAFACLIREEKYRDILQHGDERNNYQVQAYLISNLADALFLFIFSFVTGAFGCRSGGTQA